METEEVIRIGGLDMQVCVPASWDDERIQGFAEANNPCGTENGWQIRTSPELLAKDMVRMPCAGYANRVHVTLDA